MMVWRMAGERGRTQGDGVDRRHAFSAAGYHDAAWMGWGALRVVDEAIVDPGAGFAVQRRANMELLTYVIDGTLAHRGGDGVEHRVAAGGLQWVGAGRGVDVDERNASATAPLHVLQAWIQPDRVNAVGARAQLPAGRAAVRDGWQLLASPDGADGSVAIRQRASLRAGLLPARGRVAWPVDIARRGWLQVLHGSVTLRGRTLVAGDAVGTVEEPGALEIAADGGRGAGLLWFDLPA